MWDENRINPSWVIKALIWESSNVRSAQFLKAFLVFLFSFFSFLQYNYKNKNHTAVREEMVQIANYVDSVSFLAYFKMDTKNAFFSSQLFIKY